MGKIIAAVNALLGRVAQLERKMRALELACQESEGCTLEEYAAAIQRGGEVKVGGTD